MKFLASDSLPALLAELAVSAAVWVPTRLETGVVQFTRWAPGTVVELDALLARQSPKDIVFPQTEVYLKFQYLTGGKDVRVEDVGGAACQEPAPGSAAEACGSPQVIVGLRPCDARGFAQMDRVFGGYGGFYFDPYYNARRENTTLVAFTCTSPRSTCFCRAVGGSPSGTDGVDVLLTAVQGGYAAEAFTPRGEDMLERAFFVDASADVAEAAVRVKEAAESQVEKPFQLEGLREALRGGFESPLWQELSMRCISCGTCTYVCPSCYCFDINDEIVEAAGERFRCWDNCFNPMYTLETSGHNPREAKHARFRNRFSHKFWYYPDRYDSLLCTGCGRCIMCCPTRIDIREVLRTMGQAGEGK